MDKTSQDEFSVNKGTVQLFVQLKGHGRLAYVHNETVCSADNVTLFWSHLLLSAVACCSNRSISPARRADADMDRKAAAARQTDGQTYGRTPYRYMDPAAYCANSANKGR